MNGAGGRSGGRPGAGAMTMRLSSQPGEVIDRARKLSFTWNGRANRKGRFRVHYRFRSSSSHGRTFTFRVKLRGDARFPYALGYSKRVRVRVR